MTKHTPTTGSDTPDITNLMDVFEDTSMEHIDEQITTTEDQIIQREVESVKTTADAGDIHKAKELLGTLIKKFPDNKILSSQEKNIQQHISTKKIDTEIKQALHLYEQGEYTQAKKVLIQMEGALSQSHQKLYTQCLNKTEKKLEEKEIIGIDTKLQEVNSLYEAGEYAKAISLINATYPITVKQKGEKFDYSQKLNEKTEEIAQQQIVVLRTQLAQDMHTKSTQDLVKDIQHIQKLIKNIKNQDVRDTFSLFPEKDIIENLCKAYIQKDKAFGNIWVLGKKVDVDSIILRRLYKLEDYRGYKAKKDIDRVLGIHRPLLGLGEITVDDIDTKLLVSTIVKTFTTKNPHTYEDSLLRKFPITRNINEKTSGIDERTLLTVCACRGDTDIVKLLLQHPDIDVNIKGKNRQRSTPLSIAAKEGHTDVVKLLLQHPDIDVNAGGTNNKINALHLAAEKGHTDIVKLLLGHLAAEKGHPDINVNIKNEEGKTPYMLAKENGHKDIVELLSKHPGIKI